MAARNQVIAGEFNGAFYGAYSDHLTYGNSMIGLNSSNVAGWEVISEINNGKTAGNMAKRAAVGAVIAGPAGALIGGATAKDQEIFQVRVHWTNEKSSVIEMDLKRYNYLLQNVTNRIVPTTRNVNSNPSYSKPVAAGPNITINPNATPESLKERIRLFIDDKEFQNADVYANHLLDLNPKDPEVYLLKTCIELKISEKTLKSESLQVYYLSKIFKSKNYKKYIDFGGQQIIDVSLESLKKKIEDNLENEKFTEASEYICPYLELYKKEANSWGVYYLLLIEYHLKPSNFEACIGSVVIGKDKKNETLEMFSNLSKCGVKEVEDLAKAGIKSINVAELIAICSDKLKKIEKIINPIKENNFSGGSVVKKINIVRPMLNNLNEYLEQHKDNDFYNFYKKKYDDLKTEIDALYDEYHAKEIKEDKKIYKIVIACITAVVVIIVALAVNNNVIVPNKKYNQAVEYMESKNYLKAIEAFKAMNGYKDSKEKIKESENLYIVYELEQKEYAVAYDYIEELGSEYDDQKLEMKWEVIDTAYKNGDYTAAGNLLGSHNIATELNEDQLYEGSEIFEKSGKFTYLLGYTDYYLEQEAYTKYTDEMKLFYVESVLVQMYEGDQVLNTSTNVYYKNIVDYYDFKELNTEEIIDEFEGKIITLACYSKKEITLDDADYSVKDDRLIKNTGKSYSEDYKVYKGPDNYYLMVYSVNLVCTAKAE